MLVINRIFFLSLPQRVTYGRAADFPKGQVCAEWLQPAWQQGAPPTPPFNVAVARSLSTALRLLRGCSRTIDTVTTCETTCPLWTRTTVFLMQRLTSDTEATERKAVTRRLP